jgi:Raf kinase inhibitor-like YbhB/YbcL family protein
MYRHNRLFFSIGLIIIAIAVAASLHLFFNKDGRTIVNDGTTLSSLRLVSSAFKDNGAIPDPYTCRGENISPPLNIIGLPQGTKSLSLIVHNPDAVSGDFVHWTMWDIPPATEGINTNSVPVGTIQGVNGSGANTYMGPCPPAGSGTHLYIFELYALNAPLSLPAHTSRDKLQAAMEHHILDQTILTGIVEAK